MEQIAWVLGIGIFFGLLLAFPKKMLIVTGVCIGAAMLGAAGLYGYHEYSGYIRDRDLSNVVVNVSYDATECPQEYPLRTTTANFTGRTLTKVWIELVGYRPGHSDAVAKTPFRGYSSDFILEPEKVAVNCWRVPPFAVGMGADIPEWATPSSLHWTASAESLEFQEKQ